MKVLAIDPGTTESAAVVFDGKSFVESWKAENSLVREEIRGHSGPVVCEGVASYGMPVGAEVFETCVWIGRFSQVALERGADAVRITRVDVKKHLCHKTVGVNDAVIRQRLIDIFGPGKDVAIGKKKSPGPLFGISGDMWAAAALAVVWWEKNVGPVKGLSEPCEY